MKLSLAKLLFLKWLEEKPRSGYELMKMYENLLGSASPGTVYPILKELEKKGFVEKSGKKFCITEKGKKLIENVEKHRREVVLSIRRKIEALSHVFGDECPPDPPDEIKALLFEISVLASELGENAIPVLKEAIKKLKSQS